MTLVVGWISKEQENISSLYLASDSRISWKNNHTTDTFDQGRKVFASSVYPDIMAYCGDVLYPSLVLNQVIEMMDNNILFLKKANRFTRSLAIYKVLQEKMKYYPNTKTVGTLQILHMARDLKDKFSVFLYLWSAQKGWNRKVLPMDFDDKSQTVFVMGSGKGVFKSVYDKYVENIEKKDNDFVLSSTGIYQCFCRSLVLFNEKNDLYCGGAPQLVGLYRINNGMYFGTIYNEKRYFLGSEVFDPDCLYSIKWFNRVVLL